MSLSSTFSFSFLFFIAIYCFLILFFFCFVLSFILIGSSDGQNVRMQKTGKETNQKKKRRIYGADRETNFTENKFAFCCKFSIRIRNQRCSLPGAYDNERYVQQNMNHRFFHFFFVLVFSFLFHFILSSQCFFFILYFFISVFLFYPSYEPKRTKRNTVFNFWIIYMWIKVIVSLCRKRSRTISFHMNRMERKEDCHSAKISQRIQWKYFVCIIQKRMFGIHVLLRNEIPSIVTS